MQNKLKIVKYPEKILNVSCREISPKEIPGLKDLIEQMYQKMREEDGVGLAAPQIGKNLRIFVANYKELNRVVINPEVLEAKSPITNHKSPKSRQEILEGCLSLPNYYGPLKRVGIVKIKYLNEKGQETVEEFTGFNAQIIFHEVDHLNGVLFLDRLFEQKQPLYKLEKDKWEEVEL